MEWLKEILTNRGIESVDEVLADVKLALPKHYVPKNVFNQKSEEVRNLTEKLNGAPDYDKLKADFDALSTKYEKDTQELNEKLALGERNHAIDFALTKSGAKNKKALMALIDEAKIEFKEGNLSGLDEQIEALKESDGYLFENGGQSFSSSSLGGGGENADYDKLGEMSMADYIKARKENSSVG